jgi:glycine/D-amino acid oxidase-like deaminating enzyme
MSSAREVAVVGGGIIGLSVAWLLAEAGAPVTLFEAGELGQGASGAAHGQLVPPSPVLRPLWRRSLDLYRRLAATADLGWDDRPVGTLVLATGTEDVPTLLAREAAGDGQVLAPARLRALEPALTGTVAAGLLLPEGRRIEPAAVTAAIAAAARDSGARLLTGTPVAGLERRGSSWRLWGTRGSLGDHRTVVVAAGRHSRPLLDGLGHPIPLGGVRGRVLVSEPARPLLQRLVSECRLGMDAAVARGQCGGGSAPNDAAIALLAHQRRDGRLLLGGSWSPHGRPDPPDLDARLLRRAAAVVPAVAGVRVCGARAGVRPCLPDGLPVVGPVADGLFACCGHGGEGFIAGPGSALLLTQLVLGAEPFTSASPFRFGRWRAGTRRDD